MKGKAPPVPPEIVQLLNLIIEAAAKDDLGVISGTDPKTGKPKFTLAVRKEVEPDTFDYYPMGFLSTTAGEEVVPYFAEEEDTPAAANDNEVVIELHPDAYPPPMDNYSAAMIAEGVMEADEDTQLRAWQYLEDTGLGYKLQGHFGRQLARLKAEGLIRPREEKEENDG